MGFWSDLFGRGNKPQVMPVWHEMRAAAPDIPIYSPTLATASGVGITDSDAPNADQQKTAYRGLVYRLTQQRAHAIASAMMKAQVSRQVDEEEYEPVEAGHPWKALLRNPTPNADAYTFWEQTSQLRDLGRGAFHYVARGARGVPDSLYTIFPDFGEVYPQGNTMGGIAGFRYYPTGSTGYTDVPAEDLLWVRHRHPINPYESASLIEAAAYHADKDLYLQVYGRDSLKEGNNPPFYASFKEPMATTMVEAYQKQFKDKHRTIGRPGNIPVLAGGGELKTIGLNPDDLQYIETAGMNNKELMWIFGFKVSMFEDDGVVANSRELRRAWYMDSIQPEVDKLCSDLTRQLHRIYGTVDDTLCVKPPNVVPKDPMEDAKLYELEIRSGTRKPGDIIAMRGEDVPAELDQYFLSGGLRPVADMMQQPDNEPMPTL